MKKLLFVGLALMLNACVTQPLVPNTAYGYGVDVIPTYNNSNRYQQFYNNRNYQQPAPNKHNKHNHQQQPAYNNYERHERHEHNNRNNGNYSEHHDNGKHKGQNKHND